jgi:signal transduction histidine kinase
MHFDRTAFESLERYVGFTAEDLEDLRGFAPLMEPRLAGVVDDFYATLNAHPEANRIITGGDAQVQRLKHTLVDWLRSMLTVARDDAYLVKHARIGRVHVRIELPQHYMFAAMNRIRCRLLEAAFEELPAEQVPRVTHALNRALDLELAIMLDTYREDMDQRVRASARLAAIGQLAATIGHELRNPLGVIESSLFLLQKAAQGDELDAAAFDKHTARIGAQSRTCLEIINNLLDLARDRPRRVLRHAVLDSVRRGIELSGVAQTVTPSLDMSPTLMIDADPTDLAQVISNLVRNAAQAQDEAPKIWIRAGEAAGGVFLEVRDAGPGVPRQDRERIFDALFTTKARGTGLGLALCRRVLEVHQGDVSLLDSESGAVFRIFVPTREGAA